MRRQVPTTFINTVQQENLAGLEFGDLAVQDKLNSTNTPQHWPAVSALSSIGDSSPSMKEVVLLMRV